MTDAMQSPSPAKATFDGRTLSEWLPIVTSRVFEHSDVRRIIVFGSVARGDDRADSDLDLIVVLDHVQNSHDDAVRIRRALGPMPLPIDILVTDDERLETEGRVPGMMRVALREGKVVERPG